MIAEPTFKAKSVTELVAIRAVQNAEVPAVHTGAAEFGNALQTLTYAQLSRAVDRLASHYAFLSPAPHLFTTQRPPEQVISVLVSTSIDETLLEIALCKLGLTPLLLSTNNSPAAVAHLIKETSSKTLIFSQKYAEVAETAKAWLGEDGVEIELVEDRRFPLWGKGGIDLAGYVYVKPRLTPQQEAGRTAVILHSSGSTGFPKPVYISHYGLIANLHNALPLPGFSALPLFHGFGHFSIFRNIYHGQAFTLIPPHLPLTSANICRTIKDSPTPPKQHFAVPYVLKLLAETEEGIETLAQFEAVSFAGAAVPNDLGDRLTSAGVNLINGWGLTETGNVLTSKRDFAVDKEWNWLRAEGSVLKYLRAEHRGGETYELVVLNGWPAKIASNREDGSYATKDLFKRHPVHENWYQYVGRLDDTLTQTLGEKTNPVPIELAIRGNSPLIKECIVFGDSRPQVGCLLMPSEIAGDTWKDQASFIAKVWPVIEEANAKAPTHSRILPEMIGIIPPGTDIPVATKMSILRPACYKQFSDQIDAIYDAFENGTGQTKVAVHDRARMEAFITETINGVLGAAKLRSLQVDTDLFAFGVDSLQATRIRNVIQKGVELNGATLGQNVVYEHPSVAALSSYLLGVMAGKGGATSAAKQHEAMLAMVEEWTKRLIKDRSRYTAGQMANVPVDHIVLLTGATGSLGAHILQQLLREATVKKVICLSRAQSHEDSFRRVKDSLSQRLRVLTPSQMNKVVSFAADVNRDDLGLTSAEYDALQNEITAVVHNAWPVNFVLSTESFDPHIGGAVNLLNLTLKSPQLVPPAFYFSSSVGTRQGRPEPIVTEDFSSSPDTASAIGYARSKWVVEKVMQHAGHITDARVGVLRIGQLVGDTEHGVWNETEAWPLIFKAVDVVHALPDLEEILSWLPVDIAGKAIAEIVLAGDKRKSAVFHLVNPNVSGGWSEVIAGLRAGGKQFEVVDRFEWLKRLSDSLADVEKNPTYKLLGFYIERIGNTKERAPIAFDVSQTSALASSIASCPPISAGLVALWTHHWRDTGFLQ